MFLYIGICCNVFQSVEALVIIHAFLLHGLHLFFGLVIVFVQICPASLDLLRHNLLLSESHPSVVADKERRMSNRRRNAAKTLVPVLFGRACVMVSVIILRRSTRTRGLRGTERKRERERDRETEKGNFV